MSYDAFNEWERQSWEKLADAYSRSLQRLTSGSVNDLLDAVQAHSGTRLLDVGSGPGPLSAAAVDRGCVVTGVDISEAMVSIARAAVPGAEFRVGSAEELPFAAGEFDAVCGNFVIPHVGHPDRALAEALRVVRPGGRIAFTEWDPAAAMPLAVCWQITRSAGMPMPAGAPQGPDHALADRALMLEAITTAGAVDAAVHDSVWTFTVDPDEWWDAILASTPRTGAVIAAAAPAEQHALRARYDELVAQFPTDGATVAFPVTAIIGSGRRP